jgi:hypothetical protein
LRGGNDFRTGAWQGYQGKPLEVIVDLGQERQVQSVGLSCLEDTRSWIWLPSSVEIFVSENGQDYNSVGVSVQSDISQQDRIHLEVFKHSVNKNIRYIKVVAQPAFETIPSWHLGAGGKPWIFADEIIIE